MRVVVAHASHDPKIVAGSGVRQALEGAGVNIASDIASGAEIYIVVVHLPIVGRGTPNNFLAAQGVALLVVAELMVARARSDFSLDFRACKIVFEPDNQGSGGARGLMAVCGDSNGRYCFGMEGLMNALRAEGFLPASARAS